MLCLYDVDKTLYHIKLYELNYASSKTQASVKAKREHKKKTNGKEKQTIHLHSSRDLYTTIHICVGKMHTSFSCCWYGCCCRRICSLFLYLYLTMPIRLDVIVPVHTNTHTSTRTYKYKFKFKDSTFEWILLLLFFLDSITIAYYSYFIR